MFRLVLACFLILPLQGAYFTRLDQAKAVASKEEKDLYLVFLSMTTSGECVQFEKRVLAQKSFQDAVSDQFVLVVLDLVPPANLDEKSPPVGNQLSAMKFGVREVPTTFFLNSDGIVYARETGAATVGPVEHAEHVLAKAKEEKARKKALERAYEKEGLERAKALVAILRETPKGADSSLYAQHFEELTKVDPKDSLGFRKQRMAEVGFDNLDRALEEVFHRDSYDEVVKLVDEYVLKFQPQGALLQRALFPKLAALNHGKNTAAAIKAAEAVIAVDADSSYGKLAAQILKRLQAK